MVVVLHDNVTSLLFGTGGGGGGLRGQCLWFERAEVKRWLLEFIFQRNPAYKVGIELAFGGRW